MRELFGPRVASEIEQGALRRLNDSLVAQGLEETAGGLDPNEFVDWEDMLRDITELPNQEQSQAR